MDDDHVSSYLRHLPAVLREGPFLGRFLLAFEAVLTGIDPEVVPKGAELDPYRKLVGLERLLDGIHHFFDPMQTEPEFLPWLAQWVATSLRDDWSEATKRSFIANIVPLYRERGTRGGMEKVLRLSGDEAQVVDFNDGQHEDIEVKYFGSGPKPAHFFGVIVTIAERDPTELQRRLRRVQAIIEREKPAHTYYGLRILFPAMRINNDPVGNVALGKGITINNAIPLVLGTTTS